MGNRAPIGCERFGGYRLRVGAYPLAPRKYSFKSRDQPRHSTCFIDSSRQSSVSQPQRTSAPLRARPQPPVPATAHLLLPMGICFNKHKSLDRDLSKSSRDSESRLSMEGCRARELGSRLSRIKCCSGRKAGFLLDWHLLSIVPESFKETMNL